MANGLEAEDKCEQPCCVDGCMCGVTTDCFGTAEEGRSAHLDRGIDPVVWERESRHEEGGAENCLLRRRWLR